jgi:hypothetical protein
MAKPAFGKKAFSHYLQPVGRDHRENREIAEKIDTALSRVGFIEPPTDLDELAVSLGVVRVNVLPLANRGRTLKVPGGFAIEVDEALPECEQRFVIAHELAHLILEEEQLLLAPRLGDRTRGPQRRSHSVMEKQCDKAAGEILLPRRWVIREFEGTKPNLAAVKDVAGLSGCSLRLVALRLRDSDAWPTAQFVWWKKCGERLSAIDSIPERDEHLLVSLELPASPDSLVELALRTRKLAVGSEAIRYWEGAVEYRSEAMPVDGDRVVSLLWSSS